MKIHLVRFPFTTYFRISTNLYHDKDFFMGDSKILTMLIRGAYAYQISLKNFCSFVRIRTTYANLKYLKQKVERFRSHLAASPSLRIPHIN